MSIRMATRADLPVIVAMALRFVRDTVYRAHVPENPAKLEAFAGSLIDRPDADIIVAERNGDVRGMLALWCYEHPFSGLPVASELVWWVDPEARGLGVRLLRRAETWTRDHGASSLQMIAPNDHVAEFYAACGYELVERAYQRKVTDGSH